MHSSHEASFLAVAARAGRRTVASAVFRLLAAEHAGDTGLYEKLATNWLQHHVYGLTVNGVLTPLDIRMPGYPAFLALVQVVTHRSAEAARLWVMLAQVLLDLAG